MFSFPVVYRLVLNCQFWILLSSAASFVMLLWSLLPEHLPSRLAVVVLSELYDILFWTIPVCSFLPKDRVQPYGSNYGVCSAIPTPITLWIAHMVKFPCNSLTINGLLCVLACLLSQTLSDTIGKCLIFFVTYCIMSVHRNWFFFNGISPARCWSSGYVLFHLTWTKVNLTCRWSVSTRPQSDHHTFTRPEKLSSRRTVTSGECNFLCSKPSLSFVGQGKVLLSVRIP